MTSFFVPNIGFRFKAGVFDDLVDIARDKHNCFIAFYCGWPKKTSYCELFQSEPTTNYVVILHLYIW